MRFGNIQPKTSILTQKMSLQIRDQHQLIAGLHHLDPPLQSTKGIWSAESITLRSIDCIGIERERRNRAATTGKKADIKQTTFQDCLTHRDQRFGSWRPREWCKSPGTPTPA